MGWGGSRWLRGRTARCLGLSGPRWRSVLPDRRAGRDLRLSAGWRRSVLRGRWVGRGLRARSRLCLHRGVRRCRSYRRSGRFSPDGLSGFVLSCRCGGRICIRHWNLRYRPNRWRERVRSGRWCPCSRCHRSCRRVRLGLWRRCVQPGRGLWCAQLGRRGHRLPLHWPRRRLPLDCRCGFGSSLGCGLSVVCGGPRGWLRRRCPGRRFGTRRRLDGVHPRCGPFGCRCARGNLESDRRWRWPVRGRGPILCRRGCNVGLRC